MSIFEQTGEQPSITEGQRALKLFVDRTELLGRFLERMSSTSAPSTIIFLHGEPGNGKSLLAKYIKDKCCERLTYKQWEGFDPTSATSVHNIIAQMSVANHPVGHAYLDFGSPVTPFANPLEPVSALLALRKQLNDYCPIFPIFDFAWVLYLKKTNRLRDEYLKSIFPGGPLRGLAADTISIATATPWASLADKFLELVQKNASSWWTLHSAKSKISKEMLSELISLDAETELIQLLPKLFAEDLSRAHLLLPASQQFQKPVLLFDNHDAFWSGPSELSEDLYHQRDLWFRQLLGSLDLKHVVVVVTGQTLPKWSDATTYKIPASFVDSWKVGDIAETDARTYLSSAGLKDQATQDRVLQMAEVRPGEVHPLYLGMCSDAFLANVHQVAEQSAARPHEPSAETLAEKGKSVVRRFFKYVPADMANAITALAMCRLFDQRVFRTLAKDFHFSDTASTFSFIGELSFVTTDDNRLEAYRLHLLIRKLVTDLYPEKSLEVHRVLANYYGSLDPTDENTIERIYHQYSIDPRAGEVLWFHELDRATENEEDEYFNGLVSLQRDIQITRIDFRGKLLLMQARHAADLGRRMEAASLYDEVFAILSQEQTGFSDPDKLTVLKAHCLQLMGNLKSDEGKFDDALLLYDQTLSILTELFSRKGKSFELFNIWANTLDGAGYCHRARGNLADSIKLHLQALSKIEEVLLDDPTNKKLLSNKAATLGGLASVYSAEQDISKAIKTTQEMINALDIVLAQTPNYKIAVSNKGAALIEMGNLQAALGSTTAAINTYKDSASILHTAATTKSPKDLSNLGLSRQKLGELLLGLSSDDQALAAFDAANAAYDAALCEAPSDVNCINNKATCLRHSGDVHARSGETASAIKSYDDAIAMLNTVLELSPDFLNAKVNIAALQVAKAQVEIQVGSLTEASELAQSGIDSSDEIISDAPKDILSRITKAIGLKVLADIKIQSGNLDAAIDDQQAAIVVLTGILTDYPDNLGALNTRSVVSRNQAKLHRDRQNFQQTVTLLEGSYGDIEKAMRLAPGRIELLVSKATTSRDLAEVYAMTGKTTNSMRSYEIAIQCFEEALSRTDHRDFAALHNRAGCYVSYTHAIRVLKGPAAAVAIADKAIADSEAAIKLRNHNHDAVLTRAMAHMMRGLCATELQDRDVARHHLTMASDGANHFLLIHPNHLQATQLKEHAESTLKALLDS